MKVKITQCSLADTAWYYDKVGEVIDVKGEWGSKKEFWMMDDDVRVIHKGDTQVVGNEQPKFPFKVRCDDAECSHLGFGDIYTVVGEYAGTDYILADGKGTWNKSRFEVVQDEEESSEEYTGSSVSYYKVNVTKPTNPDSAPYVAECNDIIEALNMNYAEGNAFKAIWRSCAARALGVSKKGYDDGLYDAEKVVFFGTRMVEMAKK
jgi:hypothetical protein